MSSEQSVPDVGALIDHARTGDEAALGRLLAGYSAYLQLLGRLQLNRRLQGKIDAADVVQETFLEAARDFGQFRGRTEAELLAWLRQILAFNLANQVRRYLGTQRRDARLEQELAQDLEQSAQQWSQLLAASQSSPSKQAVRHEEAVRLADALGRLPDHYRDVVMLHSLQDLPFPEVARQMGRSVDSVEKLWVRALVQLRGLLEAPP